MYNDQIQKDRRRELRKNQTEAEKTKPVFVINIPEYKVDKKPNFDKIGKKVDLILKEKFLHQKIAIRALGSQEHPGKTAEDLIKIIQEIGTDRYDPIRKGDRYENIDSRQIDFFALDFFVEQSGEYFKYFVEPFYSYPPTPVRIDLVIVYDMEKLEVVEHQYEGREGEIKRDGFVFKDKDKKADAIKALIHIK